MRLDRRSMKPSENKALRGPGADAKPDSGSLRLRARYVKKQARGQPGRPGLRPGPHRTEAAQRPGSGKYPGTGASGALCAPPRAWNPALTSAGGRFKFRCS